MSTTPIIHSTTTQEDAMTTTAPESKTIAEEVLTGGAEIVLVKTHFPAHETCGAPMLRNGKRGTCEVQAYVEAEFGTDKVKMAWCAHHYGEVEASVVMQARRVVDYRPYLEVITARFKGQIA